MKPHRKYLDAIKDFPTPQGITDIRAWFGLVNQVAYAFAMASVMSPFRELLKPTSPFCWTSELQTAFDASKIEICNRICEGVQIFQKDRPTCLAKDWSKDGIGYWLFQKHCQCPTREIFCCQEGWKVTLVGSRFTHPAESRYAPIEGEALAVADALDKVRHFVLGCSDLIIAVDHKPLLKLFVDRSLEDIPNTRLRNLKEKTLRYRFRMVYIPGAKNHTSDALSRHPAGTTTPPRLYLPDDNTAPDVACPHHSPKIPTTLLAGLSITEPIDEDEDDGLAAAMCAAIAGTPLDWESLQIATAADPILTELDATIENGPPERRHHLPQSIREWFPYIHDLSTIDGVICRGGRIVIPTSLRPICLDALHAAHQGISGMTARAEAPIVSPSRDGAQGLIASLRDTFSTFGIPDTLTSDGGPEFASHDTRAFLKTWGVHHRISSAYHPHANCRAEVAVKTMKRLIACNTGPGGSLSDRFHKALLQYRNGPDPTTKISPATCLFGRATRDLLPGIPNKYKPHTEWADRMDLRERALSKRTISGRARWDEHSQGLTPLKCGDTVLIQNQTGRHPTKWDKTGTVVEVLQYHQYAVRTDGSGRLTTRNRRYLRRYDPHLSPTTTNLGPAPYPGTTYRPIPHHNPSDPMTSTSQTTTPETPPSPPPPTPTATKTPLTTPANHQTPRPLLATPGPTSGLPATPANTAPTTTADTNSPPATPRSYASVTRTPPAATTPAAKCPAAPKTILANSPPHATRQEPNQPSPSQPRRSTRGPKPIDRYGQ